jgi:hypothetical protein
MTSDSIARPNGSWRTAVGFIVKLAENSQESSPALEEPALNRWLTDRRLQPAIPQALSSLLNESEFDSIERGYGSVCWPRVPDKREIVPVLCGFRNGPYGFCVRLALVRWQSPSEMPDVLGLRFETPHGSTGVHSFHHSQMVERIIKGDEDTRIADVHVWTPNSQPSFPIQASSACDLLWAAAVTAYGRTEAALPFRGDHAAQTALSRYLKELK